MWICLGLLLHYIWKTYIAFLTHFDEDSCYSLLWSQWTNFLSLSKIWQAICCFCHIWKPVKVNYVLLHSSSRCLLHFSFIWKLTFCNLSLGVVMMATASFLTTAPMTISEGHVSEFGNEVRFFFFFFKKHWKHLKSTLEYLSIFKGEYTCKSSQFLTEQLSLVPE